MSKKWLWTGVGIVLGAAAGWLYWNQVGCASGTCAITSNPVNSTLYGGFMGGLLANTVIGKRASNTTTTKENEQPS
jgi:uncharacterized protein YcfJ